jgi:hypothetical protein
MEKSYPYMKAVFLPQPLMRAVSDLFNAWTPGHLQAVARVQQFFVSNRRGPLQGLLDINPNTAFNNQLKSLHNTLHV